VDRERELGDVGGNEGIGQDQVGQRRHAGTLPGAIPERVAYLRPQEQVGIHDAAQSVEAPRTHGPGVGRRHGPDVRSLVERHPQTDGNGPGNARTDGLHGDPRHPGGQRIPDEIVEVDAERRRREQRHGGKRGRQLVERNGRITEYVGNVHQRDVG